jgi:hypothetical protein
MDGPLASGVSWWTAASGDRAERPLLERRLASQAKRSTMRSRNPDQPRSVRRYCSGVM